MLQFFWQKKYLGQACSFGSAAFGQTNVFLIMAQNLKLHCTDKYYPYLHAYPIFLSMLTEMMFFLFGLISTEALLGMYR